MNYVIYLFHMYYFQFDVSVRELSLNCFIMIVPYINQQNTHRK